MCSIKVINLAIAKMKYGVTNHSHPNKAKQKEIVANFILAFSVFAS